MTTTRPVPAKATDLVDELEQLPVERCAAMRVLWLADDPNSSSDDLAKVAAADPALTSRIMRIANSPYYGLSGKVRSCAFAITVLGFSTVRSLAAAVAAGAVGQPRAVPQGFWLHAATTATAASIVAPRVGAKHPDAFSLGLLHDLGRSLLYRSDPEGYAALSEATGSESLELTAAERATYGIDHARAVARILKAWSFPEDFVDALANHHGDPAAATSALARSLAAGEALASLSTGDEAPDDEAVLEVPETIAAALEVGKVPVEMVPTLVTQVRRGAEGLASALNMIDGEE